MTHTSILMIGFGNVGRALARLLLRKQALLAEQYGFTFQVNGIATGRHGAAIDMRGLDLERALSLVESGQALNTLSPYQTPSGILDFIRACPADVLFENTPVNVETGQPATAHLHAALERGMHAITANKGPVVHAYCELTGLAVKMKRKFYFESTVMDGAPIFSLFRSALPAAKVQSLRGILNSTTNLILGRRENGE